MHYSDFHKKNEIGIFILQNLHRDEKTWEDSGLTKSDIDQGKIIRVWLSDHK